MLELESINQYYGESHTLWDLSIEIPQGSCVCLMGRNGVGKTTTLKCIMGLLPIQSGQIRFKDIILSDEPAERRAPLKIGYVPQGRFIFPMLTVRENMETGFACLAPQDHFIPDEIYTLFPVLKTMLDRRG